MLGEIAQHIDSLGPERNLLVPAQESAAHEIEGVTVKLKRFLGDGVHRQGCAEVMLGSPSGTPN